MDITEIKKEINTFLNKEAISLKSFEIFKKYIIKKIGNDKILKIETNFLLALVGSYFEGENFIGQKDINNLQFKHNTNQVTKEKKIVDQKSRNKKLQTKAKPNKKTVNNNRKKENNKYVIYDSYSKTTRIQIPKSKNNISTEEAEILVLERKFLRKTHTLYEIAEKMLWDLSSLLNVLREFDKDVVLTVNSTFEKNHIIYLKDQLYTRMLEIEQDSIRNKVEGPKIKPNYYKLIYNAVGTKR